MAESELNTYCSTLPPEGQPERCWQVGAPKAWSGSSGGATPHVGHAALQQLHLAFLNRLLVADYC